MKNHHLRSHLGAALLCLSGLISRTANAEFIDPNVSLTLTRINQNAVVRWFGSNTVVYQVESSSNLTAWVNASPVLTGSGAFLSVTNPFAGKSRNFFRVKRLIPDTPWSVNFNPATGVLTIIGNDRGNTITVSRNPAGSLLVNNGTVPITGGVPTVANTSLIQIFGRGGNDLLSLDETSGALPPAQLFGEADNDTLTGGSGADNLSGGPGSDILLGRGGADFLFGGDGNDTLTGGDADDQVFGDAGNDRIIWNPGDDTDLNEGGTEIDTVEINGGNGAEVFTTTANGTRVRFDRLDPAPFSIDIGTCESLVLNANGGNDSFSATGNLAALIQITVDGGTGDDTLLGSNGVDLLLGGDGNDFIDGQQGNDVAFLGAGDDTFQWDPGDGSDTVEGQAGNDTLLFNGSAANEIFDASANGSRARFTRNLANIVMDLDDVEKLNLNALGGTDTFTVNNLAGTDLTNIIANLAGTLGGSTGDAQPDLVIINGTTANDIITATLPGGDLLVTGLAANVVVDGFDTTDSVRIQGLAGEDIIDASAVEAGGPPLVIDGGSGNDILLGGVDNDNLIGGDHDDVLLGNGGIDILDGSAGENIVFQDGINATTGIVSVFGNNLNNTITISRDAAGVILNNGVAIPGATIANTSLIRVFGMDGNDTITFNEANGALPRAILFGGAGIDTLTGGSGADLLFGGLNNDTLLGKGGNDLLFGSSGDDTLTGGDADDQAFGEADNDRTIWNPGDDTDLNEGGSGIDTVEVNGGNGDEQFTTTANGTRVRFDRINPAPFSIDIGTSETLILNANGGNDSFSATGNLAALIQIRVDGGPGDDTLLGSNGADILLGGDNNDFIDGQQGNDTVFLGAGDDTFQWDPGDGSDIVEGQAGNDTLLFNGSAANENFAASANGSRARFTRDIANIVMDLDDVENLHLNALGGTDTFTVNDLAGTDLASIIANLAGTVGGSTGDALVDTVIINGTTANNVITATLPGGDLLVTGLAANVLVDGFDTTDLVRIQSLAGDDIIDASTVGPGGPSLVLDGSSGNDVLLGGAGNDNLFGGDNNDTLIGNSGNDFLFGGTGNDTLTGGDGDDQAFGEAGNDHIIWNPGDDTDLNEGGSEIDTVEINGGNGAEVFTATANGTRVRFDRLDPAPFSIDIGTCENLVLNANGGNDSFSATGNLAALIQITVDGGTGDDTLLGSNGADVLLGGDNNDFIDGQQGNDTVFLGAGDDTFQWDPGDGSDTVEGQAGNDTLLFNGSAANEIFDASANGSRVRFTRNIANIVTDLDDVENLDLNALGGADILTVNNLAGTDLTSVDAELAGTLGGSTGDAAADAITVNGTAAADTIAITANAGTVQVAGLAALVRITHSEAANDNLTVNGLGGVDIITTGPGVTALIGVTANQ